MKIQAVGTIESLTGGEEKGEVELTVTFKGKVGEAAVPAKEATVQTTIAVKSLVAENLKWGQKLYLTVSTEPPEGQ